MNANDDPRKIIPLEKRGAYSEAAGELLAVTMEIAALRGFPDRPEGDDFRMYEQILLRYARAADKLAHELIESAEANSPCHFPRCPTPMVSSLNDSEVFDAFHVAAKEADEETEFNNSKECADADRGDAAFHERVR